MNDWNASFILSQLRETSVPPSLGIPLQTFLLLWDVPVRGYWAPVGGGEGGPCPIWLWGVRESKGRGWAPKRTRAEDSWPNWGGRRGGIKLLEVLLLWGKKKEKSPNSFSGNHYFSGKLKCIRNPSLWNLCHKQYINVYTEFQIVTWIMTLDSYDTPPARQKRHRCPLCTKQNSEAQAREVNCRGQHMAEPGPSPNLLEFTSSVNPSEPGSFFTKFKKLCGLGILKYIRNDFI